MTIRMWRAPVSRVASSGKFLFFRDFNQIQDQGVLRTTFTGNNGYYLFSEAGAGVKPLVLVGDFNDITTWLLIHGESGIDNRIKELPDIYIYIWG